jgi:hypothetical protein
MRSMRNLLQINLSNNWLNGTLPAWLDEFERVRAQVGQHTASFQPVGDTLLCCSFCRIMASYLNVLRY